MTSLTTTLATELNLRPAQVTAALELFAEGATVPFVARYRKERTGNLDEVQLRHIAERHQYLTELEERRQTVLDEIAAQGKLTDALKSAILACQQKTELEDLYLPHRPKRRTRATMAKEKGLEPLAEAIAELNRSGQRQSLAQLAKPYVSATGAPSVEEALQGAADILAEQVAERADLRRYLRDQLLQRGHITAAIKKEHREGTTKFDMYRDYQAPLRTIASHNLLALWRGEREGILKVGLDLEVDPILHALEKRLVKTPVTEIRQFYQEVIKDAYGRLLKPSLTSEVMAEKKAWADGVSIQTFEANLKNLLLSPPAGMKPTLGVDPGFRTGCKVAA
ncbi:MAG: RNA-binding transcriptional accessory protein, partial [Leptolyngbyaceae cyanobacterium SM2_3_12]|nr:RNA-binding transcriptional accessory protein [Leptolyngbyaceae cyanobacterium SM2_3_12]